MTATPEQILADCQNILTQVQSLAATMQSNADTVNAALQNINTSVAMANNASLQAQGYALMMVSANSLLTLADGFTERSPSQYGSPRALKMGDVIQLSGMIELGTTVPTASAKVVVANIGNTAMRPSKRILTFANSNNAPVSVYVHTNGDIELAGGSSWVSLGNITFRLG